MAADEPTPIPSDPSALDAAELEDEERSRRRSLWGLIPVLVIIVAVIIALLLLRDCGGADRPDGGGGAKTIEKVDGLEPVEGVISLWIADGAEVGEVLAAADIDAADRLDLGGGRYVIDIAPGTEDAAVRKLSGTAGVNDAGRVYEEADSARG